MTFFIVLGILAVGVLILVHEAGHFAAGKLLGVKVTEFMIGLPSPKLVAVKRGETTYGITALPLGGYVKFAGMDPTEEPSPEDEERSFDAQPVWRKLLILGAGPTCNVIFAALIFAGIFMYGIPMPSTTVGLVLKSYPAREVGLASGDRIVAVDGRKITSWEQLVDVLHASGGKKVDLEVVRSGRRMTFTPKLVKRRGLGFLGIGPKMVDRGLGFFNSIWYGIRTTFLIAVAVGQFLIELPSKLGLLKQARGPVGLVEEGAKAARQGLREYLWLLAAFSISLGVFNLIPLPPLDGGRFALVGVEGIMRRKIPKNAVLGISAVGASVLIALMIYIVVADIGRLLPRVLGG